MPQCVHIELDENLHWHCNKLRKTIKNRDGCVTGPDALDCIEPINPEQIDRAYEEIRKEQKRDWQKLPAPKKTKALRELIEFVKQMRDGKNVGDYEMDLDKGRIWLQRRTT